MWPLLCYYAQDNYTCFFLVQYCCYLSTYFFPLSDLVYFYILPAEPRTDVIKTFVNTQAGMTQWQVTVKGYLNPSIHQLVNNTWVANLERPCQIPMSHNMFMQALEAMQASAPKGFSKWIPENFWVEGLGKQADRWFPVNTDTMSAKRVNWSLKQRQLIFEELFLASSVVKGAADGMNPFIRFPLDRIVPSFATRQKMEAAADIYKNVVKGGRVY